MAKNDKWKNIGINLLRLCFVVYIIYIIVFTLFGPDMSFTHGDKKSSRKKACYSNIRILQGAVEMYNMDNSIMMKDLDMNKLLENKYINNRIELPETSCSYIGKELTGDGTIYCELHGDLVGKIEDKSEHMGHSPLNVRETVDYYIKNSINRFLFALLSPIVLIRYIVLGK